jgi:dTDP-4-amino-4,6-dideoxygalactose transaminase
VVEDAAQGVMSTYKGRALGTIGHIGCFSFHETKNYTAGGEGGATLINDRTLVERAEIIREKGTNRSQFFRGLVDKYTWRDIGSSYLMSDLQAAYLWAQLEAAERINQQRLALWQNYYDALLPLARAGRIELPTIPADCGQNAHMFYIKLRDIEDRSRLIAWLKEAEILAVFHYIPLHSCPAGEHFGEFHGEDRYTTQESERLVRLPLFYNLSVVNQRTVINSLLSYFS